MAAKLGNGAPRSRLPRVVCAGLAGAALLALPVAAQATPTWSGAHSLAELNAPGMAAVACPSATECVAIEGPPLPQAPRTDEVTYNPAAPSSWSAYTVDRGSSPTAIACVSITRCTAVGSGGRAVTFNPRAPSRATPSTVDAGHTLRAVACPSAGQCTAVDGTGGEVTFNPASSRGSRRSQIDGSAISALACRTAVQCIAVDGFGRATTFDPATGTVSAIGELGDIYFAGLSCPSSGECVATGVFNCVSSSIDCVPSEAGNGREVTFDPATANSVLATASTSAQLYGVACPSATQCTAMDQGGQEVTFDPSNPGSASQVRVDSTGAGAGPKPTAIACPSSVRCAIVDLISGAAISFNPRSPRGARPALIATGAANVGLACPSAANCTAVALIRRSGEPGSSGAVVVLNGLSRQERASFKLASATPTAVACASQVQCTVTDSSGGVYTFNPGRPPASVNALRRIDRVAVTAIACPSATECVTVDSRGNEIMFNPARAGGASTHQLGAGRLVGVACPSARQCTAVGSNGHEVTFAPGSPVHATGARIDGTGLTGIACPSSVQCTAVDGRGQEVTFKPGAVRAVAPRRVDRSGLSGVACPAISVCVAADVHGGLVLGAPTSGKPWSAISLTGAQPPLVVACGSSSTCVALDDDGHEFTGRA